MRLPLDLSNGGWHMPKSLNFRHVNRYSEDRTSSELPEASSILMTYSREAYTELELVTKVMSVTTVARFLDWMLHCLLRFMAQVKRSNRHLCAS